MEQLKRNFDVSFENLEQLGAKRAKEAELAAREWDSLYNCGRSIVISLLERGSQWVITQGKVIGVPLLDETEPGKIKLAREGNARAIILHSMTHACKPDQPTILDEPILFSGGVIRGFEGLGVLITTHRGKQTKFTVIEEAIAERNASIFQDYFSPADPRYRAVKRLALNHFPLNQYPDLPEWLKTNNFSALVRARFKLPPLMSISPRHIEEVMREYNEVWVTAIRR